MKIIMRRNSDIFNSKKYQNWQRRQGDAFQIGIKDFNLKTVLEFGISGHFQENFTISFVVLAHVFRLAIKSSRFRVGYGGAI